MHLVWLLQLNIFLQPLTKVGLVRHRAGDKPLILRLSELGLHSLSALGQAVAAAMQPSSFGSGAADEAQGQRFAVAEGNAPVQAPIMVRNRCPLGLCFGQAGTGELMQLPSGGSVPYRWLLPPQLHPASPRLLRLCAMEAPPGPEPLQPGTPAASYNARQHPRPSAQMLQADSGAKVTGSSGGPQWSSPFDAMAEAAAVLTVVLPQGPGVLVCAHTTQVMAATAQPVSMIYKCQVMGSCMFLHGVMSSSS